jgi:aspartate ammonia-lyase
MNMAIYLYLRDLSTSLQVLESALAEKAAEFGDVVKVARTCLQDAVPVTLGQEFSGYLTFVKRQTTEVKRAAAACREIPLGGTIIGTGLGAFPGYVERVYRYLEETSEAPVVKSTNFFDSLQNADGYANISAVLKGLAIGLSKMARDLRLMSSGPRSGLAEITLPAMQPGSSIMPGKVNPVMPELIIQVCFQVVGNDTAINMAAEAGELDLNIWGPLIIKCLFESCRLLTGAIPLFAGHCVRGITANREVCRKNAESSLGLSAVIASIFGYQQGVAVAEHAFSRGISVQAAAVEMRLLPVEEAIELMDPLSLTTPEGGGQILLRARERGLTRHG